MIISKKDRESYRALFCKVIERAKNDLKIVKYRETSIEFFRSDVFIMYLDNLDLSISKRKDIYNEINWLIIKTGQEISKNAKNYTFDI